MPNPYAPPEPGRPLPDRPAQPPPRRGRRSHRSQPPPDPARSRAAARSVGHFTMLMLAGLVCLYLPVPWQAAGIAFTAAGLAVGVVALRRVLAAGLRGSLLVSLSFGLGLAALMLLLQMAQLLLWPARIELQECLSRAVTLRAEDDCRRDYERWVTERVDVSSRPVQPPAR